jgi:competence protein ComEA
VKKQFSTAAFGVVCGLLAGGLVFLVSRQPRGAAVQLSPAPTPHFWVVQIEGAVVHPGVYELPEGSRVRDIVQAAGGLSPAASSTVNLAALLSDGQFIFIHTEPSPTTLSERSNPLSITSQPALTPGAPSRLVNINTAALEELDHLPDIGPQTAQSIIDYRTTNGPFVTVEDIMDVPGIGQVKFEKIKDLITVEP